MLAHNVDSEVTHRALLIFYRSSSSESHNGGVGIWPASWSKTMYGKEGLQMRRAQDPSVRIA